MLGIAAVLALGLLGSLLGVRPLVRLFVWRLTIVLIVIALLIAAHGAQRMIAQRQRSGMLWLLACAAAFVAFARDDTASIAPWGMRGAWFALPAVVPLLIGALALARRATVPMPVMALLALPVLAWSASIAAQPVPPPRFDDDAPGVRGLRVANFRFLAKPRSVFDKARTMTPADATFLIPPSLIGFRLQARRAVYVDWKCVPMKGEEVLEWQRRMFAVMGASTFPARGYDLRDAADELYNRRSLAELAALARAEGLDYVLADRRAPGAKDPGLERVYSASRFHAYRVLSLAEKAARERSRARRAARERRR